MRPQKLLELDCIIMKIKIFTYTFLLTACFTTQAKVEIPVSQKEIIGSGIIGINSTRAFTIDFDTLLYKDKKSITYETFEIIGSGYKVTLSTRDDVNTNVNSGTINAIELITNTLGPVTSISPLMVLEQPVLTTADTVKSNGVSQQLGDMLGLSGFLNKNNSLKATKISQGEALENWKIRGFISELTENELMIGSLSIGLGQEQVLNCANGFGIEDRVEVIMQADFNYQVGNTISTILSIECLKLNQLKEENYVIPSVLQGFVDKSRGRIFWLDDVKVVANANTVYENGEKTFVENSVNVEVQGMFNSQTSQIQADKIRFLDTRIAITFPIEPQDIVIGKSITVHDLTFNKTPYTKDSTILNNGISSAKQIEIRGFVDSDGNAYISKLLNKGAANYNLISMRGTIDSLNNPFFSLLNFQVDATNSLIVNAGSSVIDANTFFAQVDKGSQIEIKNAKYNSNIDTITDGNIYIKTLTTKIQQVSTKEIIGSGIIGGFIRGTVSSTQFKMFESSFE